MPGTRIEPVLPEALFTESVLPDARQPWDPFGDASSPSGASPVPATGPSPDPAADPEVTVVAAVGVVDGVPVAMVDGAAVAVVDGVPTVSSVAGGHADAVASAAVEGLGVAAADTVPRPPPPAGAPTVAGPPGPVPRSAGMVPRADGILRADGMVPRADGIVRADGMAPRADGIVPEPRVARESRVAAEPAGVGMHRHAGGEARGGSGERAFDPADSGTWRIAHVVPGATGGRRTTTILRYLLGLLAVDRVRVLTRWVFAVPVLGTLLLLVRPRWIGAAVLVLGLLLVAGRSVAVRQIGRLSLPHRFRPVEDDLRAAVEGGKSNLRGELDRVGASGTLALVRLARSATNSDVKARLRGIEIDRILPRAQLERALRILDLAPPTR